MFRLTLEKGEPAGAVFELKSGENTLGRSRHAGLHLLSPDVSGQHARICVAGSAAHIENLSQFGTRIDGVPVAGPVPLAEGQCIEIGKVTRLRVTQVADMPMAGHEAKTGEGDVIAMPTMEATRTSAASSATLPPFTRAHGAPQTSASVAATVSPFSQGATRMGPAESELTGLFSPPEAMTGEVSEEGATHAMQTRVATPEEITLLRVNEQKRARRRLVISVVIAAPALLAAGYVYNQMTKKNIETVIGWSKNDKGEYLDAFEPALNGGRKDGGYDVMYPGNGTFRKTALAGGFVLEGRIGLKLDVPMRTILQEEEEIRLVALNRKEMVEDWIRQISASGGKWNFDAPSSVILFFGSKNGVPFTRVTYLREGNGSWFGTASILRHGSRRIVVRVEVPSAEQIRSDEVMAATPIWVSDAFEFAQWEGDPTMAHLSVEDALSQARKDIERMAPATWVAQEKVLIGLLTKAVQAGQSEAESEALQLLVKLREKQALWFNGQQFAFEAALSRGEPAKAEKLAEFAKAVFSNMEDLRYSSVRKWTAER